MQTITLWHAYSGAEEQALAGLAAEWNAAHHDVALRLVSVPYDAFPDKISAAIPNGNGPDLFVFAHDRIGDWAEAHHHRADRGSSSNDDVADRFDDAASSAMAYRGSFYGLPLAVKSLALFYRTDLVPTPPATTDEMIALGRKADLARRRAHFRPRIRDPPSSTATRAGSRVRRAPCLRRRRIALEIATPQAVAALDFVRSLGGPDGIVPPEATGTLVTTLFVEGRAGMVLSGPLVRERHPEELVPWKGRAAAHRLGHRQARPARSSAPRAS